NTPGKPLRISEVVRVTCTWRLWTERPRRTFKEVGTDNADVTLTPPSNGYTLTESESLWRYCTCVLRTTAVPERPPPGPLPRPKPPPRPPPNPPPRRPGLPEKLCVIRALIPLDPVSAAAFLR